MAQAGREGPETKGKEKEGKDRGAVQFLASRRRRRSYTATPLQETKDNHSDLAITKHIKHKCRLTQEMKTKIAVYCYY